MKKRIALIVLSTVTIMGVLLIGAAVNVNKGNEILSRREKLKDFDYMYEILEENYPFLQVNKRVTGVDWLSNKDRYTKMIKETSDDQEFYDALTEILSELHNGHTKMMDSDDYFTCKKLYEKYEESSKEWNRQLNTPAAVKRYSETVQASTNTLGTSASVGATNISTKILVEDEVAYLSTPTFNTFNIEGDMKIIKPFLQDIKEYGTLIIDIRGNGGGDSRYWHDYLVPMIIDAPLHTAVYALYRGGEFIEDFIKSSGHGGYEVLNEIQDINESQLENLPPEIMSDFKYYIQFDRVVEPKDSINFKGDIYLLVDSVVYSSAEMFASFSKHTGFATLVGERTGGDGIGSDGAICVLPNSGYAFRFSKEMGLTADGTCNEEFKTEPDIKVEAKKSVYADRDKAVQKVLQLTEK